MTTAFDRCVAAEHARWRAWKRAYGPHSCPSIMPAEQVCRMREGLGATQFGPRSSQLPPVLVGVAAGGLAFIVGTFLGALVAPHQSLGWGAVYAAPLSLTAGYLMTKLAREDPALAARILGVTTGAQVTVRPAK